MADESLERAGAAATLGDLPWYLAGQVAFFAALGAQGVLFSWLITIPLGKPADAVGIAQMLMMLPMPLLVLVGGALAERRDLRLHLAQAQAAILLPQVALFVMVLGGWLGFGGLLVYALVVGTCSAFTMPARDAALPAIVRGQGGDLMRAIATTTGLQFGAQIIGLLLAGLASEFSGLLSGDRTAPAGALPVIVVMGLLFGFAVFATLRLTPQPPLSARARHSLQDVLSEMREGLREALSHPRIRPVVLLLFATGVLFMGTFIVIFPVMSRDIYGGGSMKLAFTNASFMAGVLASTAILARRPPVRRPGRAMMVAMSTSFISLLVIHLAPPSLVLYATIFAWGGAAGISMTMSRTLVQEAAPESHRARLVSVYQLAQMGGAPLGAFAIGLVIAEVGVLNALLVPAAGVVIVMAATLAFTDLWHIERGG